MTSTALGGAREEIEVVGVFEDLLREVGLELRQRPVEIGCCAALPLVEGTFDLEADDVAAPAVGDGLLDVLTPLG